MAKYTFTCETDGVKITHELNTESDRWGGIDGPIYNFFNFLKGAGFVFDIETELGVMKYDADGECTFVSCTDPIFNDGYPYA